MIMDRPRKNRTKGSPAGTTIIDTLVTIFVIGLMLSIMSGMLIVLLRSFYYYNTKADLVAAASRMAQRVSINTNLAFDIEPSRTIGGTPYTTDGDTVVLKLAGINSTGDAIPNTFDYVVFTADSSDATHFLEVTDADVASSRKSGAKLIGETLDQYVFAYRDADPASSGDIFFAVTVKKLFRGTPLTHTLHTYAKLRNK